VIPAHEPLRRALRPSVVARGPRSRNPNKAHQRAPKALVIDTRKGRCASPSPEDRMRCRKKRKLMKISRGSSAISCVMRDLVLTPLGDRGDVALELHIRHRSDGLRSVRGLSVRDTQQDSDRDSMGRLFIKIAHGISLTLGVDVFCAFSPPPPHAER
jgi:hypothetical protein